MFVETSYNIEQFEKKFQLPFLLHSVGTFERQPNISRPSGHYCYLVIWVNKGKCFFEVDGTEIDLSEGKGIFLRPNVPHSYHRIEGDFGTGWFTYSGADSILDYYGIGDYFCFDTPSFMDNSIAALEASCCRDSNIITRSGAGYSMLTEFLQACFTPSLPLDRLVDQYLENSFARDISLDDIAAAVGMSRFSLCRRYSEKQGFTIMEQLKRIRLAKAKRYLSTTSRPINEISKMCGFDSPSYFDKIFKAEIGITPKEYRGRRST